MPGVNQLFTYTAPPPNPASVSSVFGMISSASSDFGQSEADQLLAAGDAQEAAAYGNASAISDANARLAVAGGTISQAQQRLQLNKTLGGLRAGTAANGFMNSGSAVDLIRSSTMQGNLDNQLIGLNSELKAGGYEEQSAASLASGAAASAASASASALSASLAAIASSTKTNATNLAAQLGVNIPGISKVSSNYIPTSADLGTPGNPGYVSNGNAGIKYVGNSW